MVRRLFTPVQANRTLPLVRRIVADILGRGRELRALAARSGRPSQSRAERMADLHQQVRDLVAELEQVGCTYKDWGFDLGLVDFPGKIAGERVLLCWRSDEDRVTHYHRYEDGYAGRRRIPDDLLLDELDEKADATA
jgi:hypothetical protein